MSQTNNTLQSLIGNYDHGELDVLPATMQKVVLRIAVVDWPRCINGEERKDEQAISSVYMQRLTVSWLGTGAYKPFLEKYANHESFPDYVPGKFCRGFSSKAYTNKTLRDDILLLACDAAEKLKTYNVEALKYNLEHLPLKDALGLAACIILIGDKVATKDWAVTIEGIPKKYIKLYRKCRLSGRSRFNKK